MIVFCLFLILIRLGSLVSNILTCLQVKLGQLNLSHYSRIGTDRTFDVGDLGAVCLHTHAVDSGSISLFHCLEQFNDALHLPAVALVIIVIIQLQVCRSILIGKTECIDDKLIAVIYCPPTGVGAVCRLT